VALTGLSPRTHETRIWDETGVGGE
jgi:hypothetical protein